MMQQPLAYSKHCNDGFAFSLFLRFRNGQRSFRETHSSLVFASHFKTFSSAYNFDFNIGIIGDFPLYQKSCTFVVVTSVSFTSSTTTFLAWYYNKPHLFYELLIISNVAFVLCSLDGSRRWLTWPTSTCRPIVSLSCLRMSVSW